MVEMHDSEKLALKEELNQINQKLEEDGLTFKVSTAELQNSLGQLEEQVKYLESEKERLEKQYKA